MHSTESHAQPVHPETSPVPSSVVGPADDGFSLIELLVVIVVLGVLATIVVFAVRGVTDQGQESAAAADERTLEQAQESYMALEGEYTTEDTLVARGLLREESTEHDIQLGGASGYTIVPADGSAPVVTPPAPPVPVGTTYGGQAATYYGTGPRDILVVGVNGTSPSTQALQAWNTTMGNESPPTLDRLILLTAPLTLAQFDALVRTNQPDFVLMVQTDQTSDGFPVENGMATQGITYGFITSSNSITSRLSQPVFNPFP